MGALLRRESRHIEAPKALRRQTSLPRGWFEGQSIPLRAFCFFYSQCTIHNRQFQNFEEIKQ